MDGRFDMSMESICIRRCNTIEEAEIVISWLEENGIDATVLDRNNPGPLAFGLTDREGYPVLVTQDANAKKATLLLEEHDKQKAAIKSEFREITCDKCGMQSQFDIARGAVQSCDNCGAFLDISE